MVELGGGEGVEVGCYCGGYGDGGGVGGGRVGCAAWECGRGEIGMHRDVKLLK